MIKIVLIIIKAFYEDKMWGLKYIKIYYKTLGESYK